MGRRNPAAPHGYGKTIGSTRPGSLLVSVPMALTQAFRNDDVERTPSGKAENAHRAAVPHPDHSLGIRIDDRIRHAGNETFGKLRWFNLHVSSSQERPGAGIGGTNCGDPEQQSEGVARRDKVGQRVPVEHCQEGSERFPQNAPQLADIPDCAAFCVTEAGHRCHIGFSPPDDRAEVDGFGRLRPVRRGRWVYFNPAE
jgi:hypothetical protein